MIDEDGIEIDDELWADMMEAYAQGFCSVYGGVEESSENNNVNDFPDSIPF